MESIRDFFMEKDIKEMFLGLKGYRVLLYKGILQNFLYFLGYTKEDINVKHSNELDWKKVKTLLTKEGFYDKMKAYNHRGPRTEEVKPY